MSRVIIADDHLMFNECLQMVLGKHNYEVVGVALDGVEAVRLALERRPHMILLDVNMPKMDGYTFIRELRAQGSEAAQAPVMMVSTESRSHDASRAFAAGSNCYLVKPAGPSALVLTAALLLGDAQAANKAARGMNA